MPVPAMTSATQFVKGDVKGDVARLFPIQEPGGMPGQARLDAPGVLHHVMARRIERGKIFRNARDRDDFLRRLEG